MFKLRIILFTLATLTLALHSCRKDIDEKTTTKTEVEIPEDNLQGGVFGRVVDDNDNAVVDANVFINSESVITDENGVFLFDDIIMNGYGTLVKVSKEGFFLGAKMIEPKVGQKAYTEFKLIRKELTKQINSNEESTVDLNGNSSIAFEANSFKTTNGSPYDGEVKVYAKWLDPTSYETLKEMPGDLRAVSQDNNIVQLATYGMMAVELEGANGEELNIKDDMVAELKFEVPQELLASAPASIPLWYFDESIGYWIEEEVATLVGDQYIGDVAHFSFWNCDAPFPLIQLVGSVESSNGDPFNNLQVEISLTSGVATGHGYTNDGGVFSGKVPADQDLTITIYDVCGNIAYTEDIGSFSSDVILPPIVLDFDQGTILVSGDLVRCNNEAVTNGYVTFVNNGYTQFIHADDIGHFEGMAIFCGATEFDYYAIDLDSLKTSETLTANVTSPSTDLGDIEICDVIEMHFSYTIGGNSTTVLTEAYAQLSADSMGGNDLLFLSGTSPLVSGYPTISVLVDNGPGVYNPDYIVLFDANNPNNVAICNDCSKIDINVIKFSNVIGEQIEVTFSGVADVNGIELSLEGAFKSALQ